ncbi:carboxymuconolactone decarboxylase family protein [Streptomyces sp. CBMA152]|uniref:carboxymuconolactone decarboxylase family protein n=1 Tax=Streptomyces sp. CBMA152 TaxID=1896312 RepID=UPI001CB750E7|nr:carboxymuconolactone decarboxylase family protein [Streptomyces sp. CBMA152]MBD0744968.1 alkylhydroperoxidase [Streptomyces sp. CBMA152]
MTAPTTTRPSRMRNPAVVLPAAMRPLLDIFEAAKQGGVPQRTLELVHLRASQINGCSYCVFGGVASAKKAGESDERLHVVAAWREAGCFTAPERAALALAEAATRLADRPDPVPDAVWDEAARHYDETQLAALTLMIALTNLFNRLNAATRQPAGATW